MYYFNLIDPNQASPVLEAVILGTRFEFDALLQEMGYNFKSYPIGFYHSKAKKLFLFNAETEHGIRQNLSYSRRFQQALVKVKDRHEDEFKGADSIKFQGAIDDFSKAAQSDELHWLAKARDQTLGVIRHEGAHQLFHMLGVLPDAESVYMGGWLVEGLAVYSETDPIGEANQRRMMELRYELEKHQLLPLEFLLNLQIGATFMGLDPMYVNLAYAESWAFIYFLEHNGYHEGFFNYLKEVKKRGPGFTASKDVELLETHLGKTVKEIENDFFPLVKKMTKEDVDEKAYEEFRLRLVMAS